MATRAETTQGSARKSPLPRGPHSLSRDEVATNQRARVMNAMIDLVGEQGYRATTIAQVSSRAGVSRKAFYEHFANKQECFLATYDMIVAEGFERVEEASRDAGELQEELGLGLDVLFRR